MTYKYMQLRGKIIGKYGTLFAFADVLGISQTALSRKMRGKIGLSQEEIEQWAKLLNIPRAEYGEYFFT